MKLAEIKVGNDYEFWYPMHNLEYTEKPGEELRRVRVKEVREIENAALVVGIDLDSGIEKGFYFESMGHVESIVFEPNPADRYEVHVELEKKPVQVWKTMLSLRTAEHLANSINQYRNIVNQRARVVGLESRIRAAIA